MNKKTHIDLDADSWGLFWKEDFEPLVRWLSMELRAKPKDDSKRSVVRRLRPAYRVVQLKGSLWTQMYPATNWPIVHLRATEPGWVRNLSKICDCTMLYLDIGSTAGTYSLVEYWIGGITSAHCTSPREVPDPDAVKLAKRCTVDDISRILVEHEVEYVSLRDAWDGPPKTIPAFEETEGYSKRVQHHALLLL